MNDFTFTIICSFNQAALTTERFSENVSVDHRWTFGQQVVSSKALWGILVCILIRVKEELEGDFFFFKLAVTGCTRGFLKRLKCYFKITF